MVAASKLRRAQERIQQARPFATQMLRVLNSLASRVDPGAHPLLDERKAPRGRRPRAAVRHHRRSRPVRQLQHERDQVGRRVHHRQPRSRGRARAGRPARPRLFRAPRIRGPLRADQPVREPEVRGCAGDRAARRSRRSVSGEVDSVYLVYNEFKSVMDQRVVVERLLPIPRGAFSAKAGRRRTAAPPVGASWTISTSRRRRSC